jgi:hypothetical protein
MTSCERLTKNTVAYGRGSLSEKAYWLYFSASHSRLCFIFGQRFDALF